VKPTLSLATNAGSTLVNNKTYYVVYTWILSGMEAFMSPENSITVPSGATDNLTVTVPAFPAGVTAANVYIGTTSNMETLQGTISTSAGSYTRSTALANGAAMPNMIFNMGKVSASSNTTIYVKATDSRNNSTTISMTMTVLPYSSPTTTTNFQRNNGFDSNTVLNLNGTFSNNIPNNTIMSVKYTSQQTNLVASNGYPTLTNYPSFTVTAPNYTTSPPTVNLDNTVQWTVQIQVADKLTTTTTYVIVGPGVPLLFIDSTMKSLGVGQFPSHNNSLEVTGDIYVNGTGSAPATATLSNGTNTLTVTQNTPVSIQSIKGRTLTNILGGTGSFEVSLAPFNWTNWILAENATIAVDNSTADTTTGNYSCKITSTASGNGEAYNSFQQFIDPTGYYVIVGMAKNYNASGGVGCGFFNIGNASQLRTCGMTTNTSWTPVFTKIQPSQLTGVTSFQIYGAYIVANASGQYGWVDSVRFYKITQTEYNALSGMTAAQVAAKYPYVDGSQGITNPTIDYNGNKMVVETTLHSNSDGTVYDELFVDTDGKLKKRQWFNERHLDGRFVWGGGTSVGASWHEINATLNQMPNSNDDYYVGNPTWSTLTDPLGRPYFRHSPASSNPFQYDFTTGSPAPNILYIDVPDSYTGWANGYSASADEIKAMMYGWKMYPATPGDGTGLYSSGTKYWATMDTYMARYEDGSAQLSNFASLYTNTDSWRLIYQLAAANIIEINPTGQILLPTGTDTVTLQQGVIVREKANPVYYSNNNTVFLNSLNSLGRIRDSVFQYPCAQILKIERGADDDTANWTIENWSPTSNDIYGLQRLKTTPQNYNSNYDYFVTYIAMNSATPADQMGISFPQSFRGLSDYAINTLVAHENRFDSLELIYARRQQSPYFAMLGQNGWTWNENFAQPGVMKDEFGFVHLKGSFFNGTTTTGTIITTLPTGCRPSEKLFIPIVGWTGSPQNGAYSLYINTDGTITCDQGVYAGNFALNMIPPFKAYL
jgi:hypothetical protein